MGMLDVPTFLESRLRGSCPDFTAKDFKKKLFYLFIFRGERREKERERNINLWLPLMSPYWGPDCKPGMCPDWELNQDPLVLRLVFNPVSHTSQGYS